MGNGTRAVVPADRQSCTTGQGLPTADIKANGSDGAVTFLSTGTGNTVSLNLAWTSANALSCQASFETISGVTYSHSLWNGSVPLTGTREISGIAVPKETETLVFKIVCTGNAGIATDTVKIIVLPVMNLNGFACPTTYGTFSWQANDLSRVPGTVDMYPNGYTGTGLYMPVYVGIITVNDASSLGTVTRGNVITQSLQSGGTFGRGSTTFSHEQCASADGPQGVAGMNPDKYLVAAVSVPQKDASGNETSQMVVISSRRLY